uniref:Peptidase A2B Ty3 transposon peptidase domain-containing protein n=1 Tax=Nicotiana tabacum TaxID=4097 RepID=A0A1S4BE33_TOBAC|nr:PREDICTED: uncharacterized protein LOC107807344 [Nicotiana tabacum]
MIIGGLKILQVPMIKCTKVSITREKRTWDYVPEGVISFSDEDAEGIVQPHNNVLIDSGSLANIIRSRVVEQLGLKDQIVPAIGVFKGFNMACETTKRDITLSVNTVGTIQETTIYVIEGDMSYNALLGRPWVHNMRAVPSTLQQALKFPTPRGVKRVYGEQSAAREMFVIDGVIPLPIVSTLRSATDPKGRD